MIRSKTIFLHFNRLDRDTKNLFRDFFTKENPLLMPAETHWVPNSDIYETDKGVVVKMELAGVTQNDLQITFQGQTLVITGQRVDHGTCDKVRCLQVEIPYGEFHRTVTLPGPLDFERTSAHTKEGFLIVFVPFHKSRKIKID
jgi:HSP20 family protein